MQETQTQSLVREDPTCLRATKPVYPNHWACAPEPGSCNYWAYVPQLLKPERPRACAPQQEKPPQWGAHAPQLEKSPHSNKDPAQSKGKKMLTITWQCRVATDLQSVKTAYLWSTVKWGTPALASSWVCVCATVAGICVTPGKVKPL